MDKELQIKSQFDILKNSEGYLIDTIICTTYTYNKRMLADLLIRAYCMNKKIEIEGLSAVQKKLLLKESYEDKSIKLHIFKDKKERHSAVSSSHESLPIDKFIIAVENQFVHEIEQKNGIFHPKIILVRFCKGDSKKYRLLISSKNLVMDSFYQNGVLFEGDLSKENNNKSENSVGTSVSEFLEIAKELGDVNEIRNELKNVCFRSVNEIGKDVRVMFGGISGSPLGDQVRVYIEENIGNEKIYITVLTDSLGNEFLESVKAKQENGEIERLKIISNPVRWGEKGRDIPVYAYVPEKDENSNRVYLHSKNYVLWSEKYENVVVIIGSANATEEAFVNNCEAIVVATCSKESVFDDKGNYKCVDFKIEQMTEKIMKESEKDLNKTLIMKFLSKISKQDVKYDEETKKLEITFKIPPKEQFKDWEKISKDDYYLSVELFGSISGERVKLDISKKEVNFSFKLNSAVSLYQRKVILNIECLEMEIKMKTLIDIGELPEKLNKVISNEQEILKKKPDKYFYTQSITLCDLIPNTCYYDKRDVADEKLGKYLSCGGDKDKIINNVKNVLSRLDEKFSDEEKDEIMYDEDEVEYMKKSFSTFYTMLTGEEYEKSK